MEFLLPLLAYLMGSISSAVLIARVFDMPDPRTVGSGNPGATNILRQGNKTAAVSTLLSDVLKGAIPVLIARAFTQDAQVLATVAAAAFIGHLFPVFFQFKGGKGVATALGVYLALNPWMGLALILCWLGSALLFRYSSLSAVLTAVLSPLFAWFLLPGTPFLLLSVFIAVFLVWRHQANIQRLINGEEDKIKLRKK
ncbi:MAG: glycerol-3-phosphate 1-O-acyltransferase PlsY [Arenicellales bacterium]|nr:glycerol-3-phosphate 1-O-acyltransferase PlsY [Arenicellales bacterium]